MKSCIAVAALACGAEAFVPSMTSSGLSRNDFAKILAAGVAGSAAPALALGASPKQNLFGVLGWGGQSSETVGGGGMSSPYAEIDTYSPYSPYANTEGPNAVYKGVTDEQSKQYIAIIKDCKTRFEQIPGWLSKREWSEISMELTRKAYDLRGAMLALSKGNAKGTAAAKKYFQDLEVMMTESRNKNASKVAAAFESSTADLAAYLSSI